ncbi:uncharacterized protein [Montipora capricornis]|uniref:uncharacterized protein n=1 Tax=Montipora capricornis TaxID=246305 RepID=UPI0035F1038E
MLSLVLCLISFSCFSVARGELQAVCSSGMTVLKNQTASPGVIKLTGRLPYDRNLQRSCVLKMDAPESCLHVKAKRNGNSQGFLNIFVYEDEGSSTLLGHMDVSQPKPVWNSQTICPPRSVKPRDRFMSVLGTGGVSFAVDVSQNPSEIMLDKPQPVDIKYTEAIVFPFNPPKDISDRQFDITVTSTSNTPAYLKVSQIRTDVDDNIEVVDYKKASLRLSFTKIGRITMSKVSVPPLTDSTSTWFIGIALKYSTGSLKPTESKYVTLKLSQSFDYSYAGPICTLFFVSLLLGIVVSIAGLRLFKEYLLKVNIPEPLVKVNASNRDQDMYNQPSTGQDNGNNSLSDMITKFGAFIFAMLKVAYKCWFSGGPKTYSYATGVAGFVLMIGACQFVIANWYVMIQEGDRDACYYNDHCYRVSDYHDIPLNLMISNLTYIVHALILTVCVWYMETDLHLFCDNLKKSVTSGEKATQPGNGRENGNNSDNRQSTSSGCKGKQNEALPNHVFVCPNIALHLQEGAVPEHTLGDKEKKTLMARALKRKYSYSIGYAFAWALLFEGLFSLLYHLCPSRYTFQFDSAFMFVIAGLTVLLVYNGMELSECPVEKPPGEQHPIESDVQLGEQHQIELQSVKQHPVEEPVEKPPVDALNVKEQAGEQHPGEQDPIESDGQRGEQHQIELQPIKQHPVEEPVEKAPVDALNVEEQAGEQHPGEQHPIELDVQRGEQHQVELQSVEQHPVKEPVEELPVGALNFFLYFIVPLFIFNYIGTLYHSESGLAIGLQVVFFISLIIWWIAMGLWAFHKLSLKGILSLGKCEGNTCYYIFGCIISPPALFVPIFLLMDLSQGFLFTCIVESFWAVSAKAKLFQKLRKLCCAIWKLLRHCKCSGTCTWWEFLRGFYIFVTVACLTGAFGVFLGLPTTDKTASPEDSRDLNKECAILGFFDWHDLWHFLSSFALLMGAFVVMFISAKSESVDGIYMALT